MRLLSALLLLPIVLTAQDLEPRPVPNPEIQAFSLASKIMGVPYEVVVAMPRGVAPSAGLRLPALIVTDGYRSLSPAYDAMEFLVGQQVMDPLLIVSVGVPMAEGDSAWGRRRIYEFSPPGWARQDPFGKVVESACATFKSPAGRCTGGAPDFLRMIATELVPALARRFPVDTAQLGLFGVSAGGFFASWAIFEPGSPFKRYIISSPAMAYGDGEIHRREAAWARDHRDLPIRVYMASGSLEQDDPMLEGIGQIFSGHTRLVASLRGRNYPSLRLVTEILQGLGHGDAAGTTFVRAFRTIYAKDGPAAPR